MFSLLRNRFGAPGLIAVCALVFAMIGGAYAASDDSGKATASAKAKKGPRGPRGPRGPAGPAGPAGPEGPAGPAGRKGANGADGAKGATGAKGANGSAGAQGATGPAGEKGGTGPAGPAGPEGSPWTAGGTLPSGATETGSWYMDGLSEGVVVRTAISFTFPLAEEVPAENRHFEESSTPECPGSYTTPQAAPGHLCVYKGAGTVEPVGIGVGIAGGLLILEGTGAFAFAAGSWAVTAP